MSISFRQPGTRLVGKVVVVTGAAQGIGEATARAVAAEGAVVACLDLQADAARQVAESLPSSGCLGIGLDVADEDDVVRAIAEVRDRLGGIDVLINVAGIAGPQHRAGETPVDEWDRTQAVNLRGTFLMAKHCLPDLVARRGNIVNVASALALVGWPQESAYGPSKAGVVQFTKAVALDYAPDVRSNCVCPGAVRTPMITSVLRDHPDPDAALADYGSIHPLTGRLAEPVEIAQAIVFLASDDASFVTGVALPVDGGFTAT